MIGWARIFIASYPFQMGLGMRVAFDGGIMKAVDKHQYCVGVASLSFFGGNFVLAKVRQDLISVRCSELRGVRFSAVRNVLVLWYN